MLCVIDIQTKYEFSDTVVPACLKLIKEAKEKNEYIVVVGTKHEGQIRDEIEDAVFGYPRYISVQKHHNDGAQFISQKFRALPEFPEFEEIRVCGIYTTWCVRETCRGLSKLFPTVPIKIILDACDCFEPNWLVEKKLIALIKSYDNISVVM